MLFWAIISRLKLSSLSMSMSDMLYMCFSIPAVFPSPHVLLLLKLIKQVILYYVFNDELLCIYFADCDSLLLLIIITPYS